LNVFIYLIFFSNSLELCGWKSVSDWGWATATQGALRHA